MLKANIIRQLERPVSENLAEQGGGWESPGFSSSKSGVSDEKATDPAPDRCDRPIVNCLSRG